MRFAGCLSNFLTGLCVLLFSTTMAFAQGQTRIQPFIAGVEGAWAIAPLPDGTVLITQKSGKLLRIGYDTFEILKAVPKSVEKGQGGLLDVTLARDFATTRTLFLTYVKRQGRGQGTALASARLSTDGKRLERVKDLFVMKSGSSGGRHFGSRVVEGRDGTLFMTIGDRGDRPAAQDLSTHNGTIIRVNRDGTVPADNPFVGQVGALPEIWSYGHRNPQGAGLDLQGNLWTSEHGAKGGDEVNRIRKGVNFGWPVISYGRHYSGRKIGEGTTKTGMQQPAHYWDPSIAPSGLLVYSGKMFPEWKGHIFVGSLKFDYIARLNGAPLREVGQIKDENTVRVRDIVEASDGAIWFISNGNDTIYRIANDY